MKKKHLAMRAASRGKYAADAGVSGKKRPALEKRLDAADAGVSGKKQPALEKRLYGKIAADKEAGGKTAVHTAARKAYTPKISVIMSVYNMADDPLLYQAVDSILGQTYDNWELIICDDGSTDHTLHILRRFAADQRIRVLRNSINRGAGAARNACIRASSGKYIAVMDADDVSDPRRLEKQAVFLEAHPEYAFVGCSVWLKDRRGIWGRRRLEEVPERESFLSTLPLVHPSVMIRADAVKVLRGYTQAGVARRAEDYEFFMRLYALGYKGYNMQEELVSYLEELDSYKKRNYRSRIAECVVRLRGFKQLGILKGNLRYVFKPLAVGLVPKKLLWRQHRRKFSIK